MNARKEISASLVLVVLGIGYLAYNTRYPMDTWANPGPAVFPLMVGGAFVLLALGHTVQAVRQKKEEKGRESYKWRIGSFITPSLRSAESKPFTLVLLFILYLFLMKGVGFYISNLLFVMGGSRLIGARDCIKPLSLAVGIDLFCYMLFEVWLKVSLPKGILY